MTGLRSVCGEEFGRTKTGTKGVTETWDRGGGMVSLTYYMGMDDVVFVLFCSGRIV